MAWDTAKSVDALIQRAADTFTELREDALRWAQSTPLILTTQDLGPLDPRHVYARLREPRPVPHRFSVLAAEVFHSLQTVHEHIETVARRKVIDSVVTLTPLAKSEFSMLTDLDNYAKHQALPIIGSVSSRGTAVVTDSLGQAVGSLSAVEAPTQAGDLVAAFEFDRDLAGVDTVRYDVNEVLVIGAAVFDRPSNLFDAMHKTFLQATHVSLPLLEWLNAHPERPPERRTGLGAPLPWVAPAAGKPTTPRA